jgi:hypothetical protein
MTHSIFDADLTAGRQRSGRPRTDGGYGYDVDGTGYRYDQPTITGAQLLFTVGVYPDQGLVRILDDGTRVTVTAAETVSLASGAHFRRRPRFARG